MLGYIPLTRAYNVDRGTSKTEGGSILNPDHEEASNVYLGRSKNVILIGNGDCVILELFVGPALELRVEGASDKDITHLGGGVGACPSTIAGDKANGDTTFNI